MRWTHSPVKRHLVGFGMGPAACRSSFDGLRRGPQAVMKVRPLGRLGCEGGACGAQLVEAAAEAHKRAGQVAISTATSASWLRVGLGLGSGSGLVRVRDRDGVRVRVSWGQGQG